MKYRAENMKTDKFEQSSRQTQLTFFWNFYTFV